MSWAKHAETCAWKMDPFPKFVFALWWLIRLPNVPCIHYIHTKLQNKAQFGCHRFFKEDSAKTGVLQRENPFWGAKPRGQHGQRSLDSCAVSRKKQNLHMAARSTRSKGVAVKLEFKTLDTSIFLAYVCATFVYSYESPFEVDKTYIYF